jgi:heme/copper-type cytochrome/quinol oxidase subunit 2
MKTIGKITTVVLLLIAAVLIYGFTIQKLWFWFIAPVFNVQSITIFQAYGIFLFVSIFRIRYKKKNGTDDKEFWKELLEGIGWLIVDAATIVFLGWLIMRLFM